MDEELRDLLSELAAGVASAASKTAKRLIEAGRIRDAGELLKRSDLLISGIRTAAGPNGLRVDLPDDRAQ